MDLLLAAAARDAGPGRRFARALADLLPEVLPRLGEALAGPDPARRRAALEVLGESDDPGNLPLVLAALDDPEPPVRGAALRALLFRSGAGETGPRDHLARIARLLADPDSGVRREALQVLREFGADARAAVEPYLSSDRLEVRLAAAGTGVECGLPRERVLAVLREALAAASVDLRQQAAWVLLESEEATRAVAADLAARLDDPDAGVRDLAALALVRWGVAEARARAEVDGILADREHPLHETARMATRRVR